MRLRRWRDEDLPLLHALNCDQRVYRYIAGRAATPEESEAQLARFRRHWDEHGFGIWALEERETGLFAGRCGLHYHRQWPHDPELGWALDPAVWGRGYATEAGAACLRQAFVDLGFDRVVSIVLPQNERSLRVQDRLGFEAWRELPWEDGGVLLVRSTTRAEWERTAAVAPPP